MNTEILEMIRIDANKIAEFVFMKVEEFERKNITPDIKFETLKHKNLVLKGFSALDIKIIFSVVNNLAEFLQNIKDDIRIIEQNEKEIKGISKSKNMITINYNKNDNILELCDMVDTIAAGDF